MAAKELVFNKVGKVYRAEVTVNADYALHVELEENGAFYIYQRSSDTGNYINCTLPSSILYGGKLIDYSFGHGVYPMNLRIESASKVTMATIREAEQ